MLSVKLGLSCVIFVHLVGHDCLIFDLILGQNLFRGLGIPPSSSSVGWNLGLAEPGFIIHLGVEWVIMKESRTYDMVV